VTHKAPLSEQLAQLRPRLERAQQARVASVRLTGIPGSLTLLDEHRLHGTLLHELFTSWSFSPAGTVADLRAHLDAVSAPVDTLRAEHSALRDAQHEALHGPQWHTLLQHVGSLTTERDAIGPDLRTADHRARHLAACIIALTEAAERLDAAPAVTKHQLARATADGLRALLEHSGLTGLSQNNLEGAGQLRITTQALTNELEALRPHAASLAARAQSIEQQLEEILG
jgi:hypothetical protein